ncbi:MAG: hypothetical protein JNL60_09260, partial [Bacteroidia bacterium]|nr:hypothetical protein [Bacteroidia bacterium]
MQRAIRRLLVFFILVFFVQAKATHNRAGEITYKRIAPYTKVLPNGQVVQVFTYSITITKYTNHGELVADRPIDTVYFGDGELQRVRRINGPLNCGYFNGPIGCGEIIISDPTYTVKLNTYTVTHTYSAPGNYLIRTLDPNRNAGVKNIPNSDSYPFYIESLLVINFFTGANSSPVFTFRPIDKACMGVCFEHNPGAYDPDGDSLSYELTDPRGKGGLSVPFYTQPYAAPPGTGTFKIDPITGLLSWCVPGLDPNNEINTGIGEYNMAFIVSEWRKNTSGKYEKIGHVLRDMQVLVEACNNRPPSIDVPPDICIEAGKTVSATLVVRDPDHGDFVTVEGGGGSFEATAPIAIYSPKSGHTYTSTGSSFNVLYQWGTTCDHIRSQPYYTTFKVTDDGHGDIATKLSAFRTFKIKVIPPSVKNVTAVPAGTTMKIGWDPAICNPKTNPLISYKIFRKEDCSPYTPDPCNLILPEQSGYKYLDSVGYNVTTFTDNNSGDGLVIGQDYSYVVVAQYYDGSRAASSVPICARLKRDVPVILNVDVKSTSSGNGSVWIRWARPLKTPGNLDTMVFAGPYQFNLKYKYKNSKEYKQLFNITKPFLSQLDTQYTHVNVNTVDSALEYIVEFISDKDTLGSSQKAGSVFLTATPSDRKINLQWSAKTPWINSKYTIMRKDATSNGYQLLASTTSTTYADTTNVINDSTYCYYII